MLVSRRNRLAGFFLILSITAPNVYSFPAPFPSEDTADDAAGEMTSFLNTPEQNQHFAVSALKNGPSLKGSGTVPVSPLYIASRLPATAAVIDEINLGMLTRSVNPVTKEYKAGIFPRRIIISHPSFLVIAQKLFPDAQFLINKNYSSSLNSLRSGAVDGIICDKVTAVFLERSTQFSDFNFQPYPELHAYIFLEAINFSDAGTLRSAVHSHPDRLYRIIYEKWQIVALAEALGPESKGISYIFTSVLLLIIIVMTFILTHLLRTRRETSKKLSDALQFWESLIQSIPTPTLVSTPEGTITHSNPALLNYLQTTDDALMGINLQAFSDGYQVIPPLNTRLLVDAITHPRPHFTESTIKFSGTNSTLLQWMSVIHDATMVPKGVIIGWIDITQRKMLEKELAEALRKASIASEEKSRFLAQMSHELRSPLNVITGVLESELQNNPYEGSLLPIAGSAANQLLGTIGNILDLSKIEAGELRVNLVPTSLMQLLDEITSNHRFLAEQKSLSFHSDIDQIRGMNYMCDKIKLSQIINNLLSNAVKYTTAGMVNLSVTRCNLTPERDEITIKIIDTGIGIDVKDIPLILEPYKQIDDSTPRSSGLGLSITNQLIQLMEGQLFVESEKHVGSEFRVVLTMSITHENIPVPATPHELKPGVILAVDDSPANLTVLSLQLSQLGQQIITATDGSHALSILQDRNEIDIIVTDCQMHPVDGYTLTREVRRSEDSTGKNHFILGVTANAFSDEESACLSAGMDAVLIKPFKKEALAQMLSSFDHLQYFCLDEVIALAGNNKNLVDLLKEISSGSRNELAGIKLQQSRAPLKNAIHRLKGVYGLADFRMGSSLCEDIERQIKLNHDFSITILKLERANYHFCRLIDRHMKSVKLPDPQ